MGKSHLDGYPPPIVHCGATDYIFQKFLAGRSPFHFNKRTVQLEKPRRGQYRKYQKTEKLHHKRYQKLQNENYGKTRTKKKKIKIIISLQREK